jgi:broad specificity phosphatase PhoE
MAQLTIVRHAQASFGSDNYDQLSDLGFQQSTWLGEYFREREIEFSVLVTGTQLRHRQTLEGIVPSAKNVDLVKTHPGLNEYDFSALLKAFEAVNPEDEQLQRVLADPNDKDEYFRLLRRTLTLWSEDKLPVDLLEETWQQFRQRVEEARAWLQSQSKSGQRYLVVSSGGPIAMFLGSVLELSAEKVFDLNLQMKNTGVSDFFFNQQKMDLSGFNTVPHLDVSERMAFMTYG